VTIPSSLKSGIQFGNKEKKLMAEGNGFDKPGSYEIRVKGTLGGSWSDWFDDFEICVENDQTILSGQVKDQAALHGLISKIRDVGLTLLSIQQVSWDE
jgi:hypothetical protein